MPQVNDLVVHRTQVDSMILARLSELVSAWEGGRTEEMAQLQSKLFDLGISYDMLQSNPTENSVIMFPGVGSQITDASDIGKYLIQLKVAMDSRNTEEFREMIGQITDMFDASVQAKEQQAAEEKVKEEEEQKLDEEETEAETETEGEGEGETSTETPSEVETPPAEVPSATETAEAPPAEPEPEEKAPLMSGEGWPVDFASPSSGKTTGTPIQQGEGDWGSKDMVIEGSAPAASKQTTPLLSGQGWPTDLAPPSIPEKTE